MFAQSVNFDIDPASNTGFELDWIDPSTNLPIDLTGYTAKMQIRSRPGSEIVLLELSTDNGKITLGDTLGTITILFLPEDTNVIDWSNGFYDLYVTRTADNTKTCIARGFVTVSPQITQ
jgi:hypothetical protein